MTDSQMDRHIVLGLNSCKSNAFKVFDFLSDRDKYSSMKEFWGKPSCKSSSIFDMIDNLTKLPQKPLTSIEWNNETGSCETTGDSTSVTPVTEENRRTKKTKSKRMMTLSDNSICSLSVHGDSAEENSLSGLVKYLVVGMPVVSITGLKKLKIPGGTCGLWFSGRRKFHHLQQCNNSCFQPTEASESKRIRLELSMETEAVLCHELCLQADRVLTVDVKKLIISLNVKGWVKVELGLSHIRNVTIFKSMNFMKISIKPNILTDLKLLLDDITDWKLGPLHLIPKRSGAIKDTLIIFLRTPITHNQICILKTVFSDEKILLNSSERDLSEFLSNCFHSFPKVIEQITKSCFVWSEFSKDFNSRSSVEPESSAYMPPTINRNSAISTPKKSPIFINNKSSPCPIRLVSPQPQNQTLLGTVICQPQQQFITNHILSFTPVSVSSNPPSNIDPYPNLFNRMINESPSINHQISQLSVSNPPVGLSLSLFTSRQNPINNNGNNSSNNNNINIHNTNNTGVNGMNIITPGQIFRAIPSTVSTVSTNNQNPLNLKYIPGRHVDNIFSSFNYTPSPDYSVLIHGTDLVCLNEGQYLNDNIINFYLNYIRYECITPDQRERSHLFNVFFYTKLQGATVGGGGIPPAPTQMVMTPATPEELRVQHARVAKWTKKVDIFDKDFIIIPINEAQHWFLAIICFPWMAGMVSYDKILGVHQGGQISEVPKNHSEFAMKTRVERLQRLKRENKIDPKPCILLFDSLQIQQRASNVKLIREYLKSEWDAKRLKRDGPLVFDKNTIRGFNPQVPQQCNLIDCGVYVLHYVQMFFEHPLSVFTKEYFQNSLTKWFDQKTVELKREFIQKLLLKKGESQQLADANGSSNSENVLSPKSSGTVDSGPDIEIL